MSNAKELGPEYRAALPEAQAGPTKDWQRIPGSDEATRHEGICAMYVTRMADHMPSSAGLMARPYWMNFRWAVWSHGTLLGEGYAEYEREALRAADQEYDRVAYRIRDAIKAMDIRGQGAPIPAKFSPDPAS